MILASASEHLAGRRMLTTTLVTRIHSSVDLFAAASLGIETASLQTLNAWNATHSAFRCEHALELTRLAIR